MVKARIPCVRLTDLDSAVVATIAPIATVVAKSILDIFEKLRLPKIRVYRITAIYMPKHVRAIANNEFPEAPNHLPIKY